MFIQLPSFSVAHGDLAPSGPGETDGPQTLTLDLSGRGQCSTGGGARLKADLPRGAAQWPLRVSIGTGLAAQLTFTRALEGARQRAAGPVVAP